MDKETTIIVEMLAKIQILEKRISRMEKRLIQEGVFDEEDAFDDDWDIKISHEEQTPPKQKKITTAAIRSYILTLIEKAKKEGKASITIIARDIHKDLELKRSYPMVCNAMKQCLKKGDKIIHITESGYSSTLEIKYFTN